MLSKCLNSTCSTPFRYLRDGRIYHLEIPARGEGPLERSRREYFWLCGRCCASLTVVVKNGAGTVQPRFLQLVSGERVEQEEVEKPFVS
jgi:hypothetical protein